MRLRVMVLRRALWAIPVAWGVVTITFVLSRVVTGDPVELYAPPEADEAFRAQIRQQMGLSAPTPVQYVHYLGGLLHFNFGKSFTTGRPVISDLIDRFPATMELGLLGLFFGLLIGVPLGVLAAVYRERWPDFLVRGVTVGGLALPQFWIGLVLLWIFSVSLGWLPGPSGRLPIGMVGPPRVTGFYTVDSLLAGDMQTFGLAVKALVLPVATLTLSTLAPMARVSRAAMVEAMQSDYIRTAVAMGHSKAKVWFRYGLRNALLPVVTMVGGAIGHVLAGAVLLETVFGWPGVGQYALQSLQRSDFAALEGFVIFASLLYVLAYVLVDVAYLIIDPRTKS
jgi:ABC-type dipeptide/oligopeptide/nickel transport system permease component